MQKIKTVMPMTPVCTQMYTYSESGGMSDSFLYLLFAGIFACVEPIPNPHGASRKYFLIEALLTSRTFADASDLSKNAFYESVGFLDLLL